MKEIKTLSERIKSVSIDKYPAFRAEIFEKIKVSRSTFWQWKEGNTEPNYSNGIFIDEILTKYGY